MNFFTYDIETYPNCFLFAGKFLEESTPIVFEISFRKNQKTELLNFLTNVLRTRADTYMVGYNNLHFDYPVIHELNTNFYLFDAPYAYNKAQVIFENAKHEDRKRDHEIPFKQRMVPQIDLMKINHFDNKNRGTSLKALQFAMRAQSVEDLPFEIRNLSSDEIDTLIRYNIHDVTETEHFLKKCMHLITMRKELMDQNVIYGDVLNYSDVKIGQEYLVKQIGRQKCYTGRTPNRTFRAVVEFKDVIFPKIFFRTPEFDEILDWFKEQRYYPNVSEKNEDLHLMRRLHGLEFYFGVGGLHASVEKKYFETNNQFEIRDIDVTGWYPTLAIVNRFFPEHLGVEFCDHLKALKMRRLQYPKGSSMNAMLKLAQNGAFGGSNSVHSPMYDPAYMLKTTINGQLQILQLAEVLALIPGLQIIQVNTDGITVYMPLWLSHYFDYWKKWWEDETGAELEQVVYSKMWIRDVNNYVAITKDGKIKRKGAYAFPEKDSDYDGVWNKDYSALAVQKAADGVLVKGWDSRFAMRLITDRFDYMLRHKATGGTKVMIGDQLMSKTTRFYVSQTGGKMKVFSEPKGSLYHFKRKNSLKDEYFNKILSETPIEEVFIEGVGNVRRPKHNPLIHTANKSLYVVRESSILAEWTVKECNDANKFDWNDLNREYYIQEVEKLVSEIKPNG